MNAHAPTPSPATPDHRAAKALEISNLSKSYGTVDVLKTIDVEMNAGDFLVLVGPSGCGKSTLLNCIAGLEDVSAGQLSIAGRDVTALPPRERDIAMVFQSYALYPTMTIRENIAFGMKIRGLDKEEMEEKVQRVASLLQIGKLLDRRPSQLSGGQRQRVAMGRALVRDPDLFLFDEPLSNLDAKLRVEMRAEIKDLHQRTGASIVYVTHDQVEAMTLATRIVVLRDGIVQQVGTPAEIYHAPANTFVADFMGAPPMNLIPVTVEQTATGGVVKLPDGQTLTGLPIPDTVTATTALTLGIRPEHFSPGDMLTVTPATSENTGSDSFISFDMGPARVTARLPWSHATAGPQSMDIDRAQVRFFDRNTGNALR